MFTPRFPAVVYLLFRGCLVLSERVIAARGPRTWLAHRGTHGRGRDWCLPYGRDSGAPAGIDATGRRDTMREWDATPVAFGVGEVVCVFVALRESPHSGCALI